MHDCIGFQVSRNFCGKTKQLPKLFFNSTCQVLFKGIIPHSTFVEQLNQTYNHEKVFIYNYYHCTYIT